MGLSNTLVGSALIGGVIYGFPSLHPVVRAMK